MDNNTNLLRQMKKPTKKTTTTTSNKKASKKTKPVKVVYISNPMKIKTSASKFRALVQELTGRDSEFPFDPAKFQDGGDSTAQIDRRDRLDDRQGVSSESTTTYSSGSPSINNNNNNNNNDDFAVVNNNRFEMFSEDDDVFMPQMMEGFSGILQSTLWYESPHQVV